MKRIRDTKKRVQTVFRAHHPQAHSPRGAPAWFRRQLSLHGEVDIGLRTLSRWLEQGVPEHARPGFEQAMKVLVDQAQVRLRAEIAKLSMVLP